MSLLVGIPSYNQDIETWKERFQECLKNLEGIFSVVPNVEVVFCTQLWEKENFDFIEPFKEKFNIKFLNFDCPLGVDGAKNKILDYFYETNYDYILMCDDDVVFLPNYGSLNILKEFAKEKPDLNADMIRLSDGHQPYKKIVLEHEELVSKNFVLVYCCSSLGAVHLLKNLKKYYNLPKEHWCYYYHQNPIIDGVQYKVHDDMFRRDIMRLYRFKVYSLLGGIFYFNMDTPTVQADVGFKKKTPNAEDAIKTVKLRKEGSKEAIRQICFKENLLPVKDGASFDSIRSTMRRLEDKPRVLIPREQPYIFTEKEKRYNPRKKK